MAKPSKKNKTKTSLRFSFDFIKFLVKKEQLIDWGIILILCVAGYILLKMFYPYPLAVSDSLGYIHAAEQDKFYFYRPFGYSYFLQIIHAISPDVHAVFIAQMIVYFLSTSIFAFTVKYFVKPKSKIVWYLMLLTLVLSPMGFRLANSILSDLLYGGIVYLLLASFLFIILRKNWFALIVFTLLLFSSLHVRYSSMAFPVVFAALFFMVKGPVRWVGIACMFFVSALFYNQVKSFMKETTKFDQFSTGFDGWQIANNALHVVPYIDLKPEDIKDNEVRELHEFVLMHTDSIKKATEDGKKVTAMFLWDKDLPLKMFLTKKIQETKRPYTNLWIRLGSRTFNDYGWLIVKKYPFKFMRYYLLLNAKGIVYTTNSGTIKNEEMISPSKATSWYNIPEDEDTSPKYPIYGNFLSKTTQILWIISWGIIVIVAVISIIQRKKIKFTPDEKKIFWSIFAFGVVYYGSVIFASPVEFRYWFAVKSVNFACLYILLNKLIEIKISKKSSVTNG
ncbi:MAG: hypothetical protein LBQ22_01000 [Bacteroidales bacterium]|jgi:hypothetical protein|nr:hypothetical protein [Bacteroidales bacterium]